MKLKKMMTGMMLLLSLTVQAADGGSGIGGGVTFALINWCDDAAIMVRETRNEALERLNYNNDKIGALRVFYQGLIAAAATTANTEVTQQNSLTFRAITRGVRLAQLLGIPTIINGGRIESGLAGTLQIQGLLSFMDWYTLHIQEVASAVDRTHYIPYSGRRSETPIGTAELEHQLVNIALSQLTGLEKSFVRLKTDRSSYYTTIPTPYFLQALSYLSSETASDLNETLFSSALECQSKLLIRLTRQTQTYLDGRTGSKEDAIKLNRFVLELKGIIRQTELRTCTY